MPNNQPQTTLADIPSALVDLATKRSLLCDRLLVLQDGLGDLLKQAPESKSQDIEVYGDCKLSTLIRVETRELHALVSIVDDIITRLAL